MGNKDYILHLVPVPEENQDEKFNWDSVKNSIANHALNVTRMLPAGIDIIGIFVKDSVRITNLFTFCNFKILF